MIDNENIGEAGREPIEENGNQGAAARLKERAGEAYDRAAESALSGYGAASAQVGEWPLSSVLTALAIGIGIGWALRGVLEENRRSWFEAMLDQRRIGRR
jgi:hypothetical protein